MTTEDVPKSPAIEQPDLKKEQIEELRLLYAQETIASDKHPERNEDRILIDDENRAFGIFDGMGGHEAGDVASETARDCVLRHLQEIQNGMGVSLAKGYLAKIFWEADRAIHSIARGSNMGTTGVVLKFHTDGKGKKWVLVANTGDSRAYKISEDGAVQQITIDDDNLVYCSSEMRIRITQAISEARRLEDLKEDEISYFRRRNQITKALGLGDPPPSIDAIPVGKADCFLITSDGVHDNLTTTEIREIVNQKGTVSDIIRNIVLKALERSREPKEKEIRAKADDISAVLVKCQE